MRAHIKIKAHKAHIKRHSKAYLWLKRHSAIRRGIMLVVSVTLIFVVGAIVKGDFARALDKLLDGVLVGFAEATFNAAE